MYYYKHWDIVHLQTVVSEWTKYNKKGRRKGGKRYRERQRESQREGGWEGKRTEQVCFKKSPSKWLASDWTYWISKTMELNSKERKSQKGGKDNKAFESEVGKIWKCWNNIVLKHWKHLRTPVISSKRTFYEQSVVYFFVETIFLPIFTQADQKKRASHGFC